MAKFKIGDLVKITDNTITALKKGFEKNRGKIK